MHTVILLATGNGRLPAPPRMPSDALILMNYAHPQNRIQSNRVALTAAVDLGIGTECATSAEEL